MRCAICGRLPSEACCDRCHEVHRLYWEQTKDNGNGGQGQAAGILDRLTVTTEAINQ